ncbi:hypothetical protein D0N36_03360 [Hymenobacter lapidiphilus]|uniref:hypothetical protein n=1 Tax=Hymenobacter sp. CCM 8763 TaxID=2303334 RepID=UPI000E34C33D|nr:hypothetical protein [Hymenobacter sp. CCM 8763]RFP66399.1 hypothetical protein D0N36_03360 [Hymenobacter sp. CCM 8763]
MLRTFLLALLLSLAFSVSAQSIAVLDANNGFRTYKLGMHRRSISNLKFIWADETTKSYTNPTDKLSIGAYELEAIEYRFYKDLLIQIVIKIDGLSNGQGILKALKKAYGFGQEFNLSEGSKMIMWESSKIELQYTSFIGLNEARISFYDKKLDGQKTQRNTIKR